MSASQTPSSVTSGASPGVLTVKLTAGRTTGERATGVVLALNAASALSVALMLWGEPALVASDVASLASKAATLTEAIGAISIMQETKTAQSILVVLGVL